VIFKILKKLGERFWSFWDAWQQMPEQWLAESDLYHCRHYFDHGCL